MNEWMCIKVELKFLNKSIKTASNHFKAGWNQAVTAQGVSNRQGPMIQFNVVGKTSEISGDRPSDSISASWARPQLLKLWVATPRGIISLNSEVMNILATTKGFWVYSNPKLKIKCELNLRYLSGLSPALHWATSRQAWFLTCTGDHCTLWL